MLGCWNPLKCPSQRNRAQIHTAGFVQDIQRPARRAQRMHDLVERLEVARNHAVGADLALAFAISDRPSIVSLWTSSPTNMLRFPMTYLLVCGKVRSFNHSA